MSRRKTSRTGQTVKNPIGTATRKSPKTGKFDEATKRRVSAAKKAVTSANKRALMRAAGRMIPGAGVLAITKDAVDVVTDLVPAENIKNIKEMDRTPRARMRRTERSVSPPGDTMRKMEEEENTNSSPNPLPRESDAFFDAPERMRKGGMIPSEKKGFNMLPESVQNKIDTDLAAEFMHGGEVEAPSQNVSRGTRAAIKGTKFSGVY